MKWQSVILSIGIISAFCMQEAWSYNPPGLRGGIGHGPCWRYNPVGLRGGLGHGWVCNPPGPGKVMVNGNIHRNPPGPIGGPGHGNPPGLRGGAGYGPNWHYNPVGLRGGLGHGWVCDPPGAGKVVIRK